jgi:hypothetical protein
VTQWFQIWTSGTCRAQKSTFDGNGSRDYLANIRQRVCRALDVNLSTPAAVLGQEEGCSDPLRAIFFFPFDAKYPWVLTGLLDKIVGPYVQCAPYGGF